MLNLNRAIRVAACNSYTTYPICLVNVSSARSNDNRPVRSSLFAHSENQRIQMPNGLRSSKQVAIEGWSEKFGANPHIQSVLEQRSMH